MLGAERGGGLALVNAASVTTSAHIKRRPAAPNFHGLRMSFRAGTGYRRPRAAFGIPLVPTPRGVVNEAMTADRVTWAGDRTLTWRPEPTFVPLHDVTMRRMAANLLANATEAAGLSGRVSTEVSGQAGRMLLAIEAESPGLDRLPKGLGPPCQQWHARLLSTTGTRLRPRQPRVNLQLPGTMRRMGRKVAGATCPV
jgi:hypothetical protein